MLSSFGFRCRIYKLAICIPLRLNSHSHLLQQFDRLSSGMDVKCRFMLFVELSGLVYCFVGNPYHNLLGLE